MELCARTWAEVSLKAIAENLQELARRSAPGRVAAVVKADAYGHGLVPVAKASVAAGAREVMVATLSEALALRAAGVGEALYTLAPLLPDEARDALAAGVIPFVSSPEFYAAVLAAARSLDAPARCVIALDTGMGREGMTPEEARALPRADCLRWAGVSTHLASAEEEDGAPSRAQLAAFSEAVRALDVPAGAFISWANSPALLRGLTPERLPVRPTLLRPGAALYGIEPYPGAFSGVSLTPALTWHARVTLVRALPKGATIGYGATHTLARPSRVATLAVGYADGLMRSLSNRGEVLIAGRRCRILGRISMDQCQVDVTDIPELEAGAVATLLGRDGGEEITVAQMAALAETTCHAPTTLLMPRVARLYRD